MVTDTIRIQVIGDPTFFAEIAQEASRLDRSQSWVLQRCLTSSLPELEAMVVGADAVEAMKTSPLRNPIRLQSLGVNLALADSDDPDVRELATVPKGTETRTFYLPRALYEPFDREGERLALSSDEILMWAWARNRETIHALPSLGD